MKLTSRVVSIVKLVLALCEFAKFFMLAILTLTTAWGNAIPNPKHSPKAI